MSHDNYNRSKVSNEVKTHLQNSVHALKDHTKRDLQNAVEPLIDYSIDTIIGAIKDDKPLDETGRSILNQATETTRNIIVKNVKNAAQKELNQVSNEVKNTISKSITKQAIKFSDVTIETGYGITYELTEIVLSPKIKKVVQKELRQSTNLFKKAVNKNVEAAMIEIVSQSATALMNAVREGKSLDEMSREIGKQTTETVKNVVIYKAKEYAKEEAQHLGIQAINYAAKKAGLQILKSGTKSLPYVGQILVIADILKGSAINLLDGNISKEQFIDEITNKATGLALQLIFLPPPIGAAAGTAAITSMIIASTCNAIFSLMDAAKHQMAAEKRERVEKIAKAALAEMEYQRCLMKQYIEDDKNKFDKNVIEGFNLIFSGIQNNDVEIIAGGLNCIMENFDSKVAFSNYEEFDEFFMDDDTAFKL